MARPADGMAPRDGMASSGDLAQVPGAVGIQCGSQLCAAQAYACCTDDKGATGECKPVNLCTTNAAFTCDGPEDCPPAEPVCCAINGTSVCRTASTCGGQTAAAHMCHTDADCSDGVCCRDPGSPTYAICLGACP